VRCSPVTVQESDFADAVPSAGGRSFRHYLCGSGNVVALVGRLERKSYRPDWRKTVGVAGAVYVASINSKVVYVCG